jgi:hypothetical protein
VSWQVVHGEPNTDQTEETARVLKFERRRRARPPRVLTPTNMAADRERTGADFGDDLTDDLARYEDEDAQVDYRQRMLMNVIAVAIVTVLVGAGVWIADTIAAMEKAEDCAMQGRQNCAPIELPLER